MSNTTMSNSTITLATDTAFPLPPATILLRTLTLLTLLLDLPPLLWHTRSRNLAAATLVSYIMLDNFLNFTNTFLWPTDEISTWYPGYILCDVEIKLQTGSWIGVVSCLCCMLRDLARVLDTERTVLSLSSAERTRKLLVDCLLCFGAPGYMMLAHYVVQSNRYFIFAIAGCNAGFDPSWPSVVLVYMWPPTFCLVNIYYAALIVIRIIRYQRNFSAILASSSSNLTKSRFLRLFLMALSMILVIFPVTIYILYCNAARIDISYSWSRVHGREFQDIMMVPTGGVVNFDRWIQTGAGFVVFFFFGMGRDAVKGYKKGLLRVGLGRVFPALEKEGGVGSGVGSLGSQGSGGSRSRLLDGTKKMLSLPTYSPRSLFSSSARSPTQVVNKSGYPAHIFELEGRLSASTAPSTPYSTEKHVVVEGPQKTSWFRKFLVITGLSSKVGAVSDRSTATRV